MLPTTKKGEPIRGVFPVPDVCQTDEPEGDGGTLVVSELRDSYGAVQGCLKICLSHFSYFRIKVGFNSRRQCTIHLPETGKKLRVLLRRGSRQDNG